MKNKLTEFLESCCVVDYETTGLDYLTAEILEVGLAFKEKDAWNMSSELFSSTEPVSAMISSITNITNKMLAGRTKFVEVATEYKAVLDTYTFLVAHNAFYDSKLSSRDLGISEDKWFCSMRLAKYVYQKDNIDSISLPFLRYHMDIAVPDDLIPHRAGADALITGFVFEKLLEILIARGEIDINEDIATQLRKLLLKPIIYERMTFGKYKGESVKAVPVDYWKWLILNAKQVDENADEYDPDLAATASKMYSELTQARNHSNCVGFGSGLLSFNTRPS